MESDLRRDAVQIFNAAVEAVQPKHLIPKNVRREGSTLHIGHLKFDLQKYSDLVVVGGGKASAAMALPMEAILDRYLSGGLVMTKYGYSVPLKKIRVHEGGHPVPDESGVRGTAELIRAVEPLGQEALALCLLSGGGSALLSSFEDDITLEDAQALSRLLLSAGVPIHEINTIRKHISQVGGGKLARLAHPATLITLVLSDVIGDPLESIASGPTVPDPSTFADATEILARHSLEKKLPASIRDFFSRGVGGEVPETPKPGDAVFSRCHTLVVG
ncbi:MAG: glycerate-2-kinase family protein, partial [Bacteroidota bacterium]